jgi:hypothetical protein
MPKLKAPSFIDKSTYRPTLVDFFLLSIHLIKGRKEKTIKKVKRSIERKMASKAKGLRMDAKRTALGSSPRARASSS